MTFHPKIQMSSGKLDFVINININGVLLFQATNETDVLSPRNENPSAMTILKYNCYNLSETL